MARSKPAPTDSLVTSLDGEVRCILAERLHHDESSIAWESSLAAISDDASLPELWLALEDFFDIELDNDDVQSVRTARDVVNVVRVRLTERDSLIDGLIVQSTDDQAATE